MNSLAAIRWSNTCFDNTNYKEREQKAKGKEETYRVPESGERNDTQTQEDQ